VTYPIREPTGAAAVARSRKFASVPVAPLGIERLRSSTTITATSSDSSRYEGSASAAATNMNATARSAPDNRCATGGSAAMLLRDIQNETAIKTGARISHSGRSNWNGPTIMLGILAHHVAHRSAARTIA